MSRVIGMRHVACEWVMSHMNELCHAGKRNWKKIVSRRQEKLKKNWVVSHRQEKLAYYAQLATVSKMTLKFRTAKMMRNRDTGTCACAINHAMCVVVFVAMCVAVCAQNPKCKRCAIKISMCIYIQHTVRVTMYTAVCAAVCDSVCVCCTACCPLCSILNCWNCWKWCEMMWNDVQPKYWCVFMQKINPNCEHDAQPRFQYVLIYNTLQRALQCILQCVLQCELQCL